MCVYRQVGFVATTLAMEDAPAGHDAHKYVAKSGELRAIIKKSSPLLQSKKLPITSFQISKAQAGSLEEALRICRLCYVRLKDGEDGMSMDDVRDLKKQMLGLPIRPTRKRPAAQAARDGDADLHEVKAEPVRPRKAVTQAVFKRPSEGEEVLARAVVQDFDEARVSPDEMGIDSGFKSRLGLPMDSPVRPELRPKYEFVIATGESCDGARKFSHAFRDAKPLQSWGHERHCDLCNQKCKINLFLLRCFDRTSRPFRLHKALIYAGPECSKALLREKRRSYAQDMRDLQQKLRGILTRETWREEVQSIIDGGKYLDFVLKALQAVLGMDKRDKLASRQDAGRRDPICRRSDPVLTRATKPLAFGALESRLKPQALKVQRSGSMWTAFARALRQGGKLTQLATRIRALCGPAPPEADEEQRLKDFLAKISCNAQVWDADEAKDRCLSNCTAPIATLQLCCIYGQFHGAGVGLTAAELTAIKTQVPELFEEVVRSPESDDAQAQVLPVEPESDTAHSVHSSDSEQPRSPKPAELRNPEELGPPVSELKRRADVAAALLGEAVQASAPRLEPAPAQARAEASEASAAPRHALGPPHSPSPQLQRASGEATAAAEGPSSAPSTARGAAVGHARQGSSVDRDRNKRRTMEDTVDIPTCRRGRLLGTNGSNVKELQDRYGVTITTPKVYDTDPWSRTTVTVRGHDENVDAVVALIRRRHHQESVIFPSIKSFQDEIGETSLNDLARRHAVRTKWYPDKLQVVIVGELAAARRVAQQLQIKQESIQISPKFMRDYERDLHPKLRASLKKSTFDASDGVIRFMGKAEAVDAALQRVIDWTRAREPAKDRDFAEILRSFAPHERGAIGEMWDQL
ncbi:unnamed protein product [Symbiodinium sp. CCMP2592]|nr:unnamed protein product [Symbiodinium sp. CCMP2592]